MRIRHTRAARFSSRRDLKRSVAVYCPVCDGEHAFERGISIDSTSLLFQCGYCLILSGEIRRAICPRPHDTFVLLLMGEDVDLARAARCAEKAADAKNAGG